MVFFTAILYDHIFTLLKMEVLSFLNSGTGPVHAWLPVHAHPRFSQRFVHFEADYEYQSIRYDIIDHLHWYLIVYL